MPKAAQISVDIVSDVVCPWCWLGKKHFDKARTQVKGANIDVIWRPYMLDPGVPRAGMDYKAYMTAKFGDTPTSEWKAMREHLEQAGPKVGIDYKFGQITRRPNTLDAHRLVRWAQGQKKGHKAAEALFKAFFTDLKDIGDKDVLAEIGSEIGLDKDMVAELLATDRDEQQVMGEIQYFQQLGIRGVPTFIFNGKFAVNGAQETETLVKALEEAKKHPMESDED